MVARTCMFMYACIHTYIHTYMHAYIHTYIRTYIHTRIHVRVRMRVCVKDLLRKKTKNSCGMLQVGRTLKKMKNEKIGKKCNAATCRTDGKKIRKKIWKIKNMQVDMPDGRRLSCGERATGNIHCFLRLGAHICTDVDVTRIHMMMWHTFTASSD